MRIALQERLAAKMSSTHDYVYMSQDSLTEMYTYLDSQNGQLGPFSLNQLFSWCAAGQMPPTTMVRLDKPNETFRALFDVPGFSTWVHPFAQSWHGLAQHEQQQLPPSQLRLAWYPRHLQHEQLPPLRPQMPPLSSPSLRHLPLPPGRPFPASRTPSSQHPSRTT